MKLFARGQVVERLAFLAMFAALTRGFYSRSTFVRPKRAIGSTTLRWMALGENEVDGSEALPPKANLYREWTLEQDRLLWSNKEKSAAELASLLGRGIRGVETRLSKLQDVSSPAYERLFAQTEDLPEPKEKLVPVSEVLRRVEWDYMLSPSDFSILYYDRMEDKTMESPMDATNDSVAGTETLLAKALPEHRILGVKYKERMVWDRNARLDVVFSPPGIYEVMETYDDWQKERDRVQAWNRQRQQLVAERIESILGVQAYERLQQLSANLLQVEKGSTQSIKAEVENYVQQTLELFRQVRKDPSLSNNPLLVPTGDYYALDELSELVAVLPNVELREMLLTDISMAMRKAEGKDNRSAPKMVEIELPEEELTETFVRGSGPGGQKINKTSNRVLLIHEPTQLRVECQDTRSLQQNRKIARKRLKEKLDEYLNGSQSKLGMKQQKASTKRQKSKSKNRARVRKKQLEKQLQPPQDNVEDPEEFY